MKELSSPDPNRHRDYGVWFCLKIQFVPEILRTISLRQPHAGHQLFNMPLGPGYSSSSLGRSDSWGVHGGLGLHRYKRTEKAMKTTIILL